MTTASIALIAAASVLFFRQLIVSIDLLDSIFDTVEDEVGPDR